MRNGITHEKLIEAGFKKTDDPVHPYIKILGDEGDLLMLVVTHIRNQLEFALSTPDGLVFLNATLGQIKMIEGCIKSYESNY